MKVWIVSTCIPDRGEKPCIPDAFATEAEAEAFADKMLREEWDSHAPQDDEGEPLPYPGDWRAANDAIAADHDDGSWGEWQITAHEISLPVPSLTVSRSRHTPAPWFNDPVDGVIYFDDRAAENVTPRIAQVFSENTDHDQFEADLAMLTAAPVMLAALKAVDASWAEYWPLGPDVPRSSTRIAEISEETAVIWRDIRASIAAAEGGAA